MISNNTNSDKPAGRAPIRRSTRTRVFTAPESPVHKTPVAISSAPTSTPHAPRSAHPRTTHAGAPGRSAGGAGHGGRAPMRRREAPRSQHAKDDENVVIPPIAPGVVRFVPLGGAGEVNRNMSCIEFGDDIVVVDAGLQFSDEDLPGIDFVLPNTSYLEDNKHKIRALLITHGHLDHIGAIPYVMEKIGNPPIYSRLLTTVMIKKRQEEFPQLPELDIHVVEKEQRVTFGSLSVKFFAVSHSIPDSMGIMIETPFGNIVHTGDIRVDNDNGVPTAAEEKEFDKFKKENIMLLVTDSTNAEWPGFSLSERVVAQNIEDVIKNTPGRLVIGTFASQLERIMMMIKLCEKYNRKVVVDGRSMKSNVEIVRELKMLEIKEGTFIPIEDVDQYPPDRIVVFATGAQGDEFASLMRMSNKTHKYFRLNKNDTVLLSSSIIPGNERPVQILKDNLARHGLKIVHYRTHDVHASGHAKGDELLWVHKKVGARFFVPVHGSHHMLRTHAEIARQAGTPDENIIVPDDGMIIEMTDNGTKISALKEKAPSSPILVDGFSVGNIQEVVIRDRHMLASDGMFVVIVTINATTGKLRKSPDIVSRGFVYLRESQDLLNQARLIIKKTVEDTTANMHPYDPELTKSALADNVGRFLFQKTNKRPLIIPVILGI